MMTYKILSPEWVWIFDDQRSRGVREVYGPDATALIAELEKEPTAQARQEGGQDGAA